MNVPAAQRSTFKQRHRHSGTVRSSSGIVGSFQNSAGTHCGRVLALQSYPFDFGSMCLMASSTCNICRWLRFYMLSRVSGISGAMKAGVPGLDKLRHLKGFYGVLKSSQNEAQLLREELLSESHGLQDRNRDLNPPVSSNPPV